MFVLPQRYHHIVEGLGGAFTSPSDDFLKVERGKLTVRTSKVHTARTSDFSRTLGVGRGVAAGS